MGSETKASPRRLEVNNKYIPIEKELEPSQIPSYHEEEEVKMGGGAPQKEEGIKAVNKIRYSWEGEDPEPKIAESRCQRRWRLQLGQRLKELRRTKNIETGREDL